MPANAQFDLLTEKILDSFAGGGGTSTGIELATGRIVDFAINHDPAAILMHKTNHPHTAHYQASVWDVWPDDVLHGSKLGLAWFSPDCKHFSFCYQRGIPVFYKDNLREYFPNHLPPSKFPWRETQ